jgi:hypothetical protein
MVSNGADRLYENGQTLDTQHENAYLPGIFVLGHRTARSTCHAKPHLVTEFRGNLSQRLSGFNAVRLVSKIADCITQAAYCTHTGDQQLLLTGAVKTLFAQGSRVDLQGCASHNNASV